jgi:hypothetical protein
MPLVTGRSSVLDPFAEANRNRWVARSQALISHPTAAWRQQLVFEAMKRIVKGHLNACYPACSLL